MDTYKAASAVFSRIQTIDPENASKIIAYILLQDQAEKEMIRLAFGPDNLIYSIINIAKTQLGISSNTSPAFNSSPPLSNPISISRPNPQPLFHASSSSSPSVWSVDSNRSPSYASVVNGAGSSIGSFSSPIPTTFAHEPQLQDQSFPFLDDPLELPPNGFEFAGQSHEMALSPGSRSSSLPYPCWENGGSVENEGHFLRRSFSMNDNGGGFVDNPSAVVGSPSKFDAFEGMMRSKVAQQQRLAAAQFMAGVNFPYNRSAAATLMMGEELRKLNRYRMGRNDFSGMGCGDVNPASTQIYLTFPADSTFKEEDVSNYFSIYGPVQDVRIPYQQKRMFGFVSFVYPETVKVILAKGNPHFVCDSRVLVKPYKEKGKLPEKKRQQYQLDRYEFSSCGSPFGLDCGEPLEMHVGPRMYQGNQELLSREKLEQEADWQHALELQSRRLMNLQLMDLKNHHRSLHSLNHQMYQDALEGSRTGQPQEEANEDNPMLKAADTHESSEHVLSEERSNFIAKPIEVENGVNISTSTLYTDIASQTSCFDEITRQSETHWCTDNAKPKKETESEDKVLKAVQTKTQNNPHE